MAVGMCEKCGEYIDLDEVEVIYNDLEPVCLPCVEDICNECGKEDDECNGCTYEEA